VPTRCSGRRLRMKRSTGRSTNSRGHRGGGNKSHLGALAKAQEVEPDELLPRRYASPPRAVPSPWGLRQLENGNVWMWMNLELPATTAFKIAALLVQREELPVAQPPSRDLGRVGEEPSGNG
jgi:hypothetical protein